MKARLKPENIEVVSRIATLIGVVAAIVSFVVSLRTVSIGTVKIQVPTATPSPTTPVPPGIPTQVAILQDQMAALRQEFNAPTQVTASNPNPDAANFVQIWIPSTKGFRPLKKRFWIARHEHCNSL